MDTGAIIAVVITALIIGGAVAYIIKAKRSGKKCIGCPACSACHGRCGRCECNKEAENQASKIEK